MLRIQDERQYYHKIKMKYMLHLVEATRAIKMSKKASFFQEVYALTGECIFLVLISLARMKRGI